MPAFILNVLFGAFNGTFMYLLSHLFSYDVINHSKQVSTGVKQRNSAACEDKLRAKTEKKTNL